MTSGKKEARSIFDIAIEIWGVGKGGICPCRASGVGHRPRCAFLTAPVRSRGCSSSSSSSSELYSLDQPRRFLFQCTFSSALASKLATLPTAVDSTTLPARPSHHASLEMVDFSELLENGWTLSSRARSLRTCECSCSSFHRADPPPRLPTARS